MADTNHLSKNFMNRLRVLRFGNGLKIIDPNYEENAVSLNSKQSWVISNKLQGELLNIMHRYLITIGMKSNKL